MCHTWHNFLSDDGKHCVCLFPHQGLHGLYTFITHAGIFVVLLVSRRLTVCYSISITAFFLVSSSGGNVTDAWNDNCFVRGEVSSVERPLNWHSVVSLTCLRGMTTREDRTTRPISDISFLIFYLPRLLLQQMLLNHITVQYFVSTMGRFKLIQAIYLTSFRRGDERN